MLRSLKGLKQLVFVKLFIHSGTISICCCFWKLIRLCTSARCIACICVCRELLATCNAKLHFLDTCKTKQLSDYHHQPIYVPLLCTGLLPQCEGLGYSTQYSYSYLIFYRYYKLQHNITIRNSQLIYDLNDRNTALIREPSV